MKLQPVRNRRREAFTLMEVLVVVAILVVLAGIGVVVFRYLDDSKERIAKVQIKTIESVVNSYQILNGDFPPDLITLTQAMDGKAALLDQEKITDPWGRPYMYDPNTRNPNTNIPLIYSQGMNPGDQAKYIRNWQ